MSNLHLNDPTSPNYIPDLITRLDTAAELHTIAGNLNTTPADYFRLADALINYTTGAQA